MNNTTGRFDERRADHLDDEALSGILDERLPEWKAAESRRHVAICGDCRDRLEGLANVALLLRSLPQVEPPRDFGLGPRLIAAGGTLHPRPGERRLRRLYTWTRTFAGAAAALMLLSFSADVYYDAGRPVASTDAAADQPETIAPQLLPPQVGRGVSHRLAAPESGATAPLRTDFEDQPPVLLPTSLPAENPADWEEAPDVQRAAATEAKPLPTLQPEPAPRSASRLAANTVDDAVGPLEWAALTFGLLAIASAAAALWARRRLHAVARAGFG